LAAGIQPRNACGLGAGDRSSDRVINTVEDATEALASGAAVSKELAPDAGRIGTPASSVWKSAAKAAVAFGNIEASGRGSVPYCQAVMLTTLLELTQFAICSTK
jgi:hypothetical protein